MQEDNATRNDNQVEAFSYQPNSTPYMLQSHELDLVVTGSFANVQRLLATVHSMQRLVHTRSLDIQSSHAGEIRLHWSLAMFNLQLAAQSEQELGPEPPPDA